MLSKARQGQGKGGHLLRPELVGVPTLLLAAVLGARVQPGVALTADHFIAVVFARQHHERRLNHTTPQPQDEVKSRLLLNVVVGESAAIFELLAREDESLLIRRDPCGIAATPSVFRTCNPVP
eukprot:SAG31_NODE_332_length_17516_cov_3.552840_2_plen_123_part_00